MALILLVLVVVVLLGFLGAVLSSRARIEKKSIASFHEKMGQLSGVVQPDSHVEGDEVQPDHELFDEVPTHVRVVGKVQPSRSASSSKQRVYQAPARPGSSSNSGNRPKNSPASPSRSRRTRKTQPPIFANEEDGSDSKAIDGSAVGDVAAGKGASSEVSAFVRGSSSKVHTEPLKFDDATGSDFEDSSKSRLRNYERGPNTKFLAVAALIVIIGVGAVVFSLSASHNGASKNKSSTNSTVKSSRTSTSSPPTTTTTVPKASTGPLVPSSSNSAGAVYYIDSSSLTLVIDATAPAWVEESVSPGSKILWEATIPAGGSKTLTLSSSMWIRTGNVGALKMTMNGRKVQFSAPPGVYNFTFNQGVKA